MNDNPLRVIFMGTPEFAVASLQALVEHDIQVVAVITAPTSRRDGAANWAIRP